MADLRVIVEIAGGPRDGYRYDTMAMPGSLDERHVVCGESRTQAQGIYAVTRGEVGKTFLQSSPAGWQRLEEKGHDAFVASGDVIQMHRYRITHSAQVDNVVTIRAEHIGQEPRD